MTLLAVVLVVVGIAFVVGAVVTSRSTASVPVGPVPSGDGSDGSGPASSVLAPLRDATGHLPRDVALGAVLGATGVLLGVLLWALTGLGAPVGLAIVVLLGVGGALGPRSLTDRRAAARLRAADLGVADLAGLLAVELRSGLGVDASIENVANELDGPLAEEVRVMATEVRLGLSRREALDRLRDRLPAPNVERLVQGLQHADELGAPVAHTLEALADDCTSRHFQQVREEASRLPIKILFPMMLCIFPPLLVIVAGPAMVNIINSF